MFESLFTRLSGEFHMIAPDYPGFGPSDTPSPKDQNHIPERVARAQ
jgi:pimeloyl-ACP methyl ester carboxylesterase